jgi:four helix bundle protein
MAGFFRVEDLLVYQRLVDLHLEVCLLTKQWPAEERYELGAQIRRSSNSSPANLAEKHSDRHVRNKIEGVNRSRGEALETIHHLYVGMRKGYVTEQEYVGLRGRYEECVRMLNGLEKKLDSQLDEPSQRWNHQFASTSRASGLEPINLNPEP